MKRIKIVIILLIAVLMVLGYTYIYQDHRDIKTETSAYVISSHQLSNEFKSDISSAEKKYLNQTIEVTGMLTEIEKTTITLNEKIFCQFAKQINNLSLTEHIKIKGRVIGYDDLLEQVKLDQCHIIN